MPKFYPPQIPEKKPIQPPSKIERLKAVAEENRKDEEVILEYKSFIEERIYKPILAKNLIPSLIIYDYGYVVQTYTKGKSTFVLFSNKNWQEFEKRHVFYNLVETRRFENYK
ncbi:hypothetical protein [Ornithobacterium rhinotracheale]|uniref:hypothetical protein n=1 Tax=Ornithobacterium rhinotracheale TaxID=28251 RepID=UPI00129C5E81|nr:hypothetical protein [Ornithobacterium rhinotracheale]MRJ09725.1 hypothetical protein [Ornithobacterium rhinotracheale]